MTHNGSSNLDSESNLRLSHKDVNGVKFAFIDHKGVDPLTIVQIHGHGADHVYLMGIFDYPELTKYNIVIPDQVGHGDSSKPEGFSYKLIDQAKAINQLLLDLNITDNIVLLGSSLGGAVAVLLAEMMGEAVIGLITAEGTLDPNDASSGSKALLQQYTLDEYVATGFQMRLDELSKMPGYEFVVESQRKAGPVIDYLSRRDYVRLAEEDTLIERLDRLGVPVLAVYGGDNKGNFTSEKRLAALKQCKVVYIPNAGHAMMIQNPDVYYREVSDFIKEKIQPDVE